MPPRTTPPTGRPGARGCAAGAPRPATAPRYDGVALRRAGLRWAATCVERRHGLAVGRGASATGRGAVHVDRLLADATREFGGFDAVVLWHAYPVIGVDERNQFDYYRRSGAPTVVADLHAARHAGVRRLQPVGRRHPPHRAQRRRRAGRAGQPARGGRRVPRHLQGGRPRAAATTGRAAAAAGARGRVPGARWRGSPTTRRRGRSGSRTVRRRGCCGRTGSSGGT